MDKPTDLHPDLVADRQTMIDRIGDLATRNIEAKAPYSNQQIDTVRRTIRVRCPDYRNCRQEDWCWQCASGQEGQLFRGETCLSCKLLTSEGLIVIKPTLRIVVYENHEDIT
jgi:hypothetical protein